jgi:ABC-2 type transport system permease protein
MSAIFKRELKSYFITPLGYVFIGVYLIFSGIFFYLFTLRSVSPTLGSVDFTMLFSLMFFVLMVTVPLLTMRLLSEERKNKTDQLTLTAPVGLFGLVWGKFSAAYAIFLISTAIIPIYGLVLAQYTEVSWRSMSGNMIGLIMLGAVYTSAGLLVSSFTENQMVAAIISVFVNIGFVLSSIVANQIPAGFSWVAAVLRELSLLERYDRFTIGLFELENVLFFASITFVFLFLTVRVLEKRRWS